MEHEIPASRNRSRTRQGAQEVPMLMTIGIVLLVLWALGLFAFHVSTGFIHVLIVLAIDRHRDAPGERKSHRRVSGRNRFPLAVSDRPGCAGPKVRRESSEEPMNRRTRGILTVAVSMTLALLVAGCSTTQPAGRQIDDASIHAAVMAKLTVDRFSNIVNIDINVTNGVVTLAGRGSERPGHGRRADRSPDRLRSRPRDQQSSGQVAPDGLSPSVFSLPGRAAMRLGVFLRHGKKSDDANARRRPHSRRALFGGASGAVRGDARRRTGRPSRTKARAAAAAAAERKRQGAPPVTAGDRGGQPPGPAPSRRRRSGCSTTSTSSRSRSARSSEDLPPGFYRELPKLASGAARRLSPGLWARMVVRRAYR